jgi:hypothetical protein
MRNLTRWLQDRSSRFVESLRRVAHDKTAHNSAVNHPSPNLFALFDAMIDPAKMTSSANAGGISAELFGSIREASSPMSDPKIS